METTLQPLRQDPRIFRGAWLDLVRFYMTVGKWSDARELAAEAAEKDKEHRLAALKVQAQAIAGAGASCGRFGAA